MKFYDIKELGPRLILQQPEALARGQVLPADNPLWQSVRFAKGGRL